MAMRSTNTFVESLQKLLQEVASMKAMPDADLEFLVQIETAILQQIRNPSTPQDPAQAAQAAPPPPGLQGIGQGGMQGLAQPGMPDMEGMARMLSGGA